MATSPVRSQVRATRNASELLVFGNPPKGHKRGCKCFVCKRARAKNPGELLIFGNPAKRKKKNASKLERQRATRDRAARIRDARVNPRLIDEIRHGDKVTILVPAGFGRGGQEWKPKTGRAVMRSSSGGWVLNMGGPHGTPGLADDRNVVRVKRSKNPVRMTVFHDPAIKKFTAALYDPKFGNLYASGFTKKQAAQALRDRVREYRRSGKLPAGGGYGNPKRATPRRRRKDRTAELERQILQRTQRYGRKKRRNPDETGQAVKLFQSFHGRDPKDIVEKHVSAEVRKDYAALGDLEHLKVVTPIGQTVKFDFHGDGVKLASSPDGKQLYCIGGNQNLTSCLSADSLQKDFVDLGEAVEVQYLARKVHGNFEPISYFHKFGEKSGALPQLMYDKLKKQIFFVGGEYFINAKQGVSPGIEN